MELVKTEIDTLAHLKKLLKKGCKKKFQMDNHPLNIIQKAVLKKFFAANWAKIDYKQHKILLSLQTDGKILPNVEITYNDLYKVLSECVSTDSNSKAFYQSIINFYIAQKCQKAA